MVSHGCGFSVAVDTSMLSLHLYTGVTSHIDDEYQLAGVDDPRILITTSRSPSARLKQFAKVCWRCAFQPGYCGLTTPFSAILTLITTFLTVNKMNYIKIRILE